MHYFNDIKKELNSKNTKDIDYFVGGEKFIFTTHPNIFSRNKVDDGSDILIKAIIKEYNLDDKKVLDLGCGYGVVGIVLNKFFKNLKLTMADITSQAISLTSINSKKNNLSLANTDIIKSDLYKNVESQFDFIISNPPIRAGKNLILDLITKAYTKLLSNGKLILVIRKKQGMATFKNHAKEVFGNVKIVKRDKGYYVLESQKVID